MGFDVVVVLVPAAFALASLLLLVRGINQMVWTAQVSARGGRTTGMVTEVHRLHGSRFWNRALNRREVIAFAGGEQQVVGSPTISDVGDLNRVGMSVTVRYDRARPKRFIAPLDGKRISPVGQLLHLPLYLLLLGVALWLLVQNL